MRLPTYWWFARFAQFALVLSIAFALITGVGVGLWPSFYVWLTADEWHWMPFDRWMLYVVKAAIGGVVAGALSTNYEWLAQTPSSLLRKVLTTAVVVALCAVSVVIAREHVGRIAAKTGTDATALPVIWIDGLSDNIANPDRAISLTQMATLGWRTSPVTGCGSKDFTGKAKAERSASSNTNLPFKPTFACCKTQSTNLLRSSCQG